MVVYIVVFALLLYESIIDIKTKTIDIGAAILVGIMGILLNIFVYGRPILWLCGGLIGIVLIFAAWISHQRIGYGDGIIFTVLGLCIEPVQILWLLWLSMSAAGVYGAAGIITRRRNKNSSLPFIPFVAVGYMVLGAVRMLGE